MSLTIDESTFARLYPDLVGLYSHFNTPPLVGISKEEFEQKYLSSKLWRLCNIYTITNKDGDLCKFNMNYAQHVVYARSRQHPRVIILKSRQQGISTLWLVSYFDDSVFCSHLSLGLMAQGADEAATLLERTKLLWDKLNGSVKGFLNIALDKDNSKEFSFSNGSKIFIRVSFRSATLQRLHVSEYGKIANRYPKRAREVKTGSLQALARGNTGIIESTAEGINDFKDMWDKAIVAFKSNNMSLKDFYPIFLPWWDDPDCVEPVTQYCNEVARDYFEKLTANINSELGITDFELTQEQKNFWIVQYRELEGDVYQEYPGTSSEAFQASKNGSFWSTKFTDLVVMRNRVQNNVYDPNLPVDVFFDLGMHDYMVLTFVQYYRGQIRIIDEYYNDGYGLEHYIDEIHSRNYNIRNLHFPHDIEVRDLSVSNPAGQAIKRLQVVRNLIKQKRLQWKAIKVSKSSLADGIQAVRGMLNDLIIDAKCKYLISCFHKYSKEWDDKLGVWKKTPLHDKYSHGADSIRLIAIGVRKSDSSKSVSSISSGISGISGFDI